MMVLRKLFVDNVFVALESRIMILWLNAKFTLSMTGLCILASLSRTGVPTAQPAGCWWPAGFFDQFFIFFNLSSAR